MLKKCVVCRQNKASLHFYQSPAGPRRECKTCSKESSAAWQKNNPDRQRDILLWSRYRITVKDLLRLLARQRSACAICRAIFDDSNRYVIDHDHLTFKVRGLLCRMCNSGLGFFRDNKKALAAALKYVAI